MPQMSPMLWTILFLMFTLLFLFFNVLNYFNFSPIFKNSNIENKTDNDNKNNNTFLTWKW
ncbi:ATP synthase F0 subunit 8 (mitochondrion) [Chironomus tepperi]|uniref:ATP synthase complex subunit 8 n=1 Tax=Chironomus tepperi TaxID=113505 RepID=G8J8G7_9DIPT|nr:ATP synthase F0 subunit 8 [Chironomus tepperi]AET13085.1 ATP synthase F0 subunit 8 [Chironomus tepperi]